MKNLLLYLLFSFISLISFSQKPDFIVLFDFNKSTLSSSEKEKLLEWSKEIKNQNIEKITLIGHCDSIGDYNYNLNLSKKRALQVQQIINYKATQTLFKSDTQPINSNQTEKGRQLNRRVEVYIEFNKAECYINSKNQSDSIQITTFTKASKRSITLLSSNTFNAENTEYITLNQKGSLPLTLTSENIKCPIILDSIKTNERFTLTQTHFIPNTPKFMDNAYTELDNLLLTMQKNPTLHIKLEGHTNGVSTKKDPAWHYNMSTLRAKAVRDFLIKNAISPDRISYKGYGCDRMINPEGRTPEARTANRRVEVLITKY